MREINEIKELDALVSLIDEPNEDMFTAIRQKVLTYGKLAIPRLEEAWVNTLGDSDSERIETLIEEIRRQELIVNIERWKDSPDQDLLEAYTILMRYLKPDFEEQRFKSFFDKLYREIWLELNEALTALERIKVFNHILFLENKLSAMMVPPVKSDSFLLNNLSDRKSGSEYIVGLLYASLAQKMRIPVYGVDLPGHFILVFMDDIKMEKTIQEYDGDDVMFYINPGNEGAVFTHNEIKHYINQLELKLNPIYFLPTTNHMVLKRIITQLSGIYKAENNHIKNGGLDLLLSAY